MQDSHIIIGIHVQNRVQNASDIQKILTEHGCSIKTRLGLHEVQGSFCAAGGIIILEMVGDGPEMEQMVKRLTAIDGVDVQKMVFDHDR